MTILNEQQEIARLFNEFLEKATPIFVRNGWRIFISSEVYDFAFQLKNDVVVKCFSTGIFSNVDLKYHINFLRRSRNQKWSEKREKIYDCYFWSFL